MSKKIFVLVFFISSVIVALLAAYTRVIRPRSIGGLVEYYYLFYISMWILVGLSTIKKWLGKKQFFIIPYFSGGIAYIGMAIYYIITRGSYPSWELIFLLFFGGSLLLSGAILIIPIMYTIYFILTKLQKISKNKSPQ